MECCILKVVLNFVRLFLCIRDFIYLRVGCFMFSEMVLKSEVFEFIVLVFIKLNFVFLLENKCSFYRYIGWSM